MGDCSKGSPFCFYGNVIPDPFWQHSISKILFVLAGIVSLSTDGTDSFRIYLANLLFVALAIFTNESMMGTSVSTPTVVASAAPLCNPKRLMATATASSKKLEAPIIPAGAAMS